MREEDWRVRAECRGRDPEVWFPVRSAAAASEEARRVCRGCPV
ncbi:WhiB family transcriptional regulator, partial [Escherichia coli]